MFSTLTSRLLLGAYILILLSIPVGSYFISQSKTSPKNQTVETTPKPTAKATLKPSSSLNFPPAAGTSSSPLPSSEPESPEIAKTFGPTLSFTAILEGRQGNNQAVKMFIGIVEGMLNQNPKFLLSFSVDLPASGKYSNLSLAGLSPGSTYTALLKGSAQIATSSAFTMSPSVTNLNAGEAIPLLSGDLNDDNIVNSADYSIAQKGLGSNPDSSTWNENADLNKDGLINTFDLGIIAKNIGQVGASGAWISPVPQVATQSGGLNQGLPRGGAGGYWIWIPESN